MNTVIVLGVAVIVWVQWPEAMKSHTIGVGYEPGVGASVYLAILLTAFPALLYAVAVHITLRRWLFGPDEELRVYRARQLVESLASKKASEPDPPKLQDHDFAD